MSAAFAILALALAMVAPAKGDPNAACDASGRTPFERPDVRAVCERIVCYCGCPHLQVSKCFCGTADEIRDDVALQLNAGKSADEVIAAYIAEHGTWALAVPPRRGFNWIIWFGPAVLLVAGTALVLVLGRRWTLAADVPAVALDAADATRLREQLTRSLSDQD